MEVRNLFFNTPVRRKFLRSPQTEMGHVSEAFMRIGLAHPQAHFSLRHNDRVLYDLPATDDWGSRISAFFGSELADQLIWIESTDGPVKLYGYVANPAASRGNNRLQYLFLNGRYIRDRSLGHALSEAYRGLLLTGRYPIVFLRMEIPPEAIDVNVHPTKLEVRFQDSGQVYSQLLATLRNRLLSTALPPRVPADPVRQAPMHPAVAIDATRAARERDQFIEWARGKAPSASGESDEATWSAAGQPAWDLPPPGGSPSLDLGQRSIAPRGTDAATRIEPAGLPPAMGRTPEGYPALQIHNRYLITQSEEGVVVIDQHALHERILYEELRLKVLAGALETQNLLVPQPVRLSPTEAAAVLEAAPLLGQLGIGVEPFGGDTVLVSSYPAMLANLHPEELVRQLLEKLMSRDQKPDRRDVLDDLLHMISCKAAVKAGDRLAPGEISALVQRRHLVQDSHHCPHGRPTALVFTRAELDRRFKRT